MMHEPEVVKASEKIYTELSESGLDVLLDDRDLRAGVKFNDADLLGTPVRITVGMRNLKNSEVEMKLRTEKESSRVPLQDALALIKQKVKELYDSIK